LKGKGYPGSGVTSQYTYVSPGHHFRGTAIPWESKVSFKHSEVLSYQSENEFLVRFLVCRTIEHHSMKVAGSIRNYNGVLGSQQDIFHDR
jgi:hypothetical protein